MNEYGLKWTQSHVSRAEQGLLKVNSLPTLAVLCIVLRCSVKRLLRLPDEHEGTTVYVGLDSHNFLRHESLIHMMTTVCEPPEIRSYVDGTQDISLEGDFI